MKVYIAGPITGVFNYRNNFKKVERKITAMGHVALNPAYLPSGLKDYMPTCKAMIDQSDMVYFLSGSDLSIGANEELIYAIEKGKGIKFEDEETQKIMLLST